MKILTVDIGTGTQDIFLYDSRLNLENGFKLIAPSPTMIVHQKIKQATQSQQSILLNGVTMGGGPNQWAVEAHIRAGLPLYATEDAARSFNDDLQAVEAMGIRLVSEDEAVSLPESIYRIELHDFNFSAICNAFEQFNLSLEDLTAVAVAVFDHGNAPPDISDRKFRFDYLDERIRQYNRLSAFAFRAEDIPPILTRLLAVKKSATDVDVPLMVMDTAPAAVLGATFDPHVENETRRIIANVGNFHTLAFRLGESGIEGVFEHHTGFLDCNKLDDLIEVLASGSMQNQDIFDDHGHGALIYNYTPLLLDKLSFGVAVTGPRRNLLLRSKHRPYFAVPFGDMMLCGCFGLLAALADVMPELAEQIIASLRGNGEYAEFPWEV